MGYPGMSEERCRGCKMLGGHTIETEAEARAFTSAMRAHPASWPTPDLNPAPVAVGDTIELEPCVAPADYRKQFGRDCPRVELLPENGPAAELVFATLPEHTRQLLPAFVEALVAEMGDEAGPVVLRAFRTLQGPAVTNWLKAQFSPPEGDS